MGIRLTRISFLILLSWLAACAADARTEAVRFPGARAEGYQSVQTVTGDLRVPPGVARKRPAVVILHGSAGVDERGAYYAEALNAAGIATLEVEMFERSGKPRRASEKFTHLFGALRYLAQRPDIDPTAIGVTGFSWGANLSLRAVSKNLSDAFLGDPPRRFAAHIALYPVCWRQERIRAISQIGTYAALTGAPVLLFAGGRDDNGGPDDCRRFIAALPDTARERVTLHVYPDATHGWDRLGRPAGTVQGASANRGRGGPVRVEPDRRIAADSRDRTVAFFLRVLRSSPIASHGSTPP